MIKKNQLNQKNIIYKYRLLFFYCRFMKPYLDKIPFYRKIAKKLWLWHWQFFLKIKSRMQSIDLNKIYWIDPKKIEYSFHENWHYLSKKLLYPDNGRENYHDLNFPGNLIKFEDRQAYSGLYQHFIQSRKWPDTDFYHIVLRQMQEGVFRWGCSSEEEFKERCTQLDKLYKDIKEKGYKTQKNLDSKKDLKSRGIREARDEIKLFIGRDGDLIHCDGQHRLVMAKLLNLKKVPFKIYERHPEWLKFRKKLFRFARKEMNGKTLEPLLHPDLREIISLCGNKRFEMLKRNIKIKNGTLLDMFSHWGYFCHQFEEMGYDCTAYEENLKNGYFLNKLKRAGNKKFTIIEESIYKYKNRLHFDIVLMLNFPYSILDNTGRYNQFLKLLKKINTSEIYFQLNPLNLSLRKNGESFCKDDLKKQLIDMLLKNTNLKNVNCIGEIENDKIFKLS